MGGCVNSQQSISHLCPRPTYPHLSLAHTCALGLPTPTYPQLTSEVLPGAEWSPGLRTVLVRVTVARVGQQSWALVAVVRGPLAPAPPGGGPRLGRYRCLTWSSGGRQVSCSLSISGMSGPKLVQAGEETATFSHFVVLIYMSCVSILSQYS